MTATRVETRPGVYADSVALMQVSSKAAARPGVHAAMVAMATPLNLELLRGMGFAVPDGAGINDLVVAVTADDDDLLDQALKSIDTALTARSESRTAADLPPRTVSAAARHSGPGLALISVPGQHAFTEAMDALDAGCDVMIFSDNVPLEQEVLLKQRASESGLLVMGPDCGTAVVGGVGLGFAHTVQPGPVGIVAASGTGAQHVMCLLDTAGIGITACLGVGGRDLAAAVGGRSTRTALDLLDADPATELIIVISKPAPAEVSDDLRAYAATLSTPVHFAVIGQGQPDLSAATAEVIGALGLVAPTWPTWAPPGPLPSARSGSLRGLFVGGTLCDEAMVIASQLLGPIGSNIPLHPESLIDPRAVVAGHSMIDFGDDALTVGRPHPMIDPSLRLRQLARDGADDQTAVILLDVVLGHGSHPDPASELAAAIRQCLCPVVVTLVGARDDPQSLAGQADALRGAGAHVFASNAEATRFACSLVGNPATEENPATEVNPATAENPAPHEVSA